MIPRRVSDICGLGSGKSTLARRWGVALDLPVCHMDGAPVWLRRVRVIRRSLRQEGRARADMARDRPERLSLLPDFLWFILTTARSGRRKQSAFFAATRLMRYRLRSVSEVEAFVLGLGRCA